MDSKMIADSKMINAINAQNRENYYVIHIIAPIMYLCALAILLTGNKFSSPLYAEILSDSAVNGCCVIVFTLTVAAIVTLLKSAVLCLCKQKYL